MVRTARPPLSLRVRLTGRRRLVRGLAMCRWLSWCAILGRGLRTHGAVSIGPRVTLKPHGVAQIDLGRHVEIECDVNMESRGRLSIGARTFVGHGTTIGCGEQVIIGEDCLIGEYVSIRDHDHAFDATDRPINAQGSTIRPVRIEDDVWIGAKATVVAGVRIGRGSVIGANAVVTRDIPPYAVAVGAPARVIRYRVIP